MANNNVIERAEDTNTDLVDFSTVDFNKETFANEYEKEILTKNEGNDIYKIIEINEPNLKGKLAVIYDASKVKLGVSAGTGTSLNSAYGQFITKIASRYNAVLEINGGGF
jgi:exopolysaccharide biosynthesis protein